MHTGQAPFSRPSTSAQFPPDSYQHTYTTDARAPQLPSNPDPIGPPVQNNLQRSTEDPASASPAAYESPNLDHRDSEPKRSIKERLVGLAGGISRENLLDSPEEQGSTNRLRRKVSARKKEGYQYSPQSPPTSASGRTSPPSSKRRPVDIPEETETGHLRDLADFFRSTAPPTDTRRRPISLVGDPSTAQAHWNKLNSQDPGAGEAANPKSRPRSGSLGDNLERKPSIKSSQPLQTTQPPPPNPLQSSPTGPTQLTHPQYQAYHPASGEEPRQAQPVLPPLQTQGTQGAQQNPGLHLGQLSPLRQHPVDQQHSLAQVHASAESPPHFEVQGPDQRISPDSLEHGIASELQGHLTSQQNPPVLGSAAPRQGLSPTKEVSPGMPPANQQASLQLPPPRKGSAHDVTSEPVTPNVVNQSRMQQQQQQQQQPPGNQNVQRAQSTAEGQTGRSTPPPPITAKDMSEEEVNNLLRDYKELSRFADDDF